MNRLFSSTLCTVLALSMGAASLSALEAEGPTKWEKPVLSLDPSPVTEKAPGLVSYADVLEPAQRYVVSVYSSKTIKSNTVNPLLRQYFNIPDQERKQEGLGSGVLVSSDGYIITNNHVVEGADKLNVQLYDDREFTATLVGTDPKTDVAIIKIDVKDLPFATLADSDKLRVGDVVFALGNPLGVGQTVTMGIVSALGRNKLNIIDEGGSAYENFIQTDASINFGNSGGALVDARGRLVGINTAIMSPSRGSIGIGFAIPVNMAASVMHSLIDNNGVVQRGMLGVTGGLLTPDLAESLGLKADQRGVIVTDLHPLDGPAAKAGIKPADVIIAINGKTVASVEDLKVIVAPMSPGSLVKVKLLREGKEQNFEVTLGKLERDGRLDELFPGVKAAVLSPELRAQYEIDKRINGVVITEVDENSPFKDRLAPGLVILEIERKPVMTMEQVQAALVKGKKNLLYVYYHGLLRYISLPVR